jgi:hypothetical protein
LSKSKVCEGDLHLKLVFGKVTKLLFLKIWNGKNMLPYTWGKYSTLNLMTKIRITNKQFLVGSIIM